MCVDVTWGWCRLCGGEAAEAVGVPEITQADCVSQKVKRDKKGMKPGKYFQGTNGKRNVQTGLRRRSQQWEGQAERVLWEQDRARAPERARPALTPQEADLAAHLREAGLRRVGRGCDARAEEPQPPYKTELHFGQWGEDSHRDSRAECQCPSRDYKGEKIGELEKKNVHVSTLRDCQKDFRQNTELKCNVTVSQ